MVNTGSNVFRNAAGTPHESDEESLTPIQTFFSNTKIFLTGITGFLGILIVEKLLFTCPNVSTIYVLVRSKKGKDVEARMKQVLDDVVFTRLRTHYPNFMEKIVPVEGDCELPHLGLSLQDREMLIRDVDVVFHGAATVRFDESLSKAATINVRAVRDILALAREMPNLKSFVHISTAFSNCIHSFVKEEFYPPPMDYDKLLALTEGLPDDLLTVATPMLLDKFPNTYTFTKQIGEDVVRQEGRGLPIGVHRPAIIISTYKDPLPGWINNIYGPTGLMLAAGVGLIRTTLIDTNYKANIVPADLVVNSIIACAWDVAENFAKDATRNIPVFNFELDRGTRITWGTYFSLCQKYCCKYYTTRAIWYPVKLTYKSPFAYAVATFFVETIPAAIVDLVRIVLLKPPMLLKVYRKIAKMETMLLPFKAQEWDYESTNTSALLDRMSRQDKKIFYCDVKDLDWVDYLQYHVRGMKLYLLNESIETLPEGHKHYKKLYRIHQLTKATFTALALWILWLIFSLTFSYMF